METSRNILLQGIVGSTAYGLAGPDSDIDQIGVYAIPKREIFTLGGPSKMDRSIQQHDPDVTYHEVYKYVKLVLACNPTAMELLWLKDYTIKTKYGQSLIDHRSFFLTRKRVQDAYLGYATQQARRLLERQAEGKDGFSSDVKNRTAKHGRHTFRLMLQGKDLLQTGQLTVDVTPNKDYLFEMGDLAANHPEKFIKHFELVKSTFDNIVSVIPEEADLEVANDLLVMLREQLP